MLLAKRKILSGVLAMPFIIRIPGLLMPIKSLPRWQWFSNTSYLPLELPDGTIIPDGIICLTEWRGFA